jgi:hypothetical protein
MSLLIPISDTTEKYVSGCWRPYEACLTARLRANPTADNVEAFIKAFGLTRCFPGEGMRAQEKFGKVPGWLGKASKEIDGKGLVEAVNGLANDLNEIGRGSCESAASKLIWALRPDLGVIRDGRAFASLRTLGRFMALKDESSYGTYVRRFNHCLNNQRAEVDNALARHGDVLAWEGAANRIFDFWLYENNGESRP